MKKALLYIHGKDGQADEAEHYRQLLPMYTVVGLDYMSQIPWENKAEFLSAYRKLTDSHTEVVLIANSIGAYFAMNALSGQNIKRAFFISPVVNMEKLITDIMHCSNITEEELARKKQIKTTSGETLSWKYLCYVREHPIVWNISTDILYGEHDFLTSADTIAAFAQQNNATLTIMKNGEHWFHTDKQMDFLDNWLKQCLTK